MSITQDIRAEARKVIDPSPIYVAVGMTDLWVETVRESNARFRAEFTTEAIEARSKDIVGQVRDFPKNAYNEGVTIAAKFTETYEELQERGEKLIDRIRHQKATQELIDQADATVSIGKGVVTTARNAMHDVESSAKATLTTGRKEVRRAGRVIADSMRDEAKVVADELEKSAKRTRTAARRTATTTKNAAKKTTSRAKAADTSARKTAAKSVTAATKSAKKVGD